VGPAPKPDGGSTAITIVITTRNRRELVRRALETMLRQDVSPDQYEILVLDNSSTDGTADMVRGFLGGKVRVRHEIFNQVGATRARNHATTLVNTDIVAFCDDDVSVGPEFVGAIIAAFAQDPEVQTIGGRIVLGWMGDRPDWLPFSHEGYFGKLDLGMTRMDLIYPQAPYGAIMAFRTATLRKYGGFPTMLGPGKSMRFNDEIAVFKRQAEAGCKIVYDPRILLTHHVFGGRATVKYFLRRVYAQGWSDAVLDGVAGTLTKQQCLDRAWERLGVIAQSRTRRLAGIIRRQDYTKVAIVEWLAIVAQDLGFIAGALRMAFTPELRSGNWTDPTPAATR
jgi:glycosyltransferase involved in cell wall biosynthesis